MMLFRSASSSSNVSLQLDSVLDSFWCLGVLFPLAAISLSSQRLCRKPLYWLRSILTGLCPGSSITINQRLGAFAHYAMVLQIQRRSFWLVTQLYSQTDGLGSNFVRNVYLHTGSEQCTLFQIPENSRIQSMRPSKLSRASCHHDHRKMWNKRRFSLKHSNFKLCFRIRKSQTIGEVKSRNLNCVWLLCFQKLMIVQISLFSDLTQGQYANYRLWWRAVQMACRDILTGHPSQCRFVHTGERRVVLVGLETLNISVFGHACPSFSV